MSINLTVPRGESRTLKLGGKYCHEDIVVSAGTPVDKFVTYLGSKLKYLTEEDLRISKTFTSLEWQYFNDLESITFPADIHYVELNSLVSDVVTVFKSLKWIRFQSSTPPRNLIVHSTTKVPNILIYVPNDAVAAYKEACPRFADLIFPEQLKGDVISMGTSNSIRLKTLEKYCDSDIEIQCPSTDSTLQATLANTLVEVTIPGSVSTIGSYAFFGNSKLKKVVLEKMCTVGSLAFGDCSALESISPVLSINGRGLYRCTALKKIYVNNQVGREGLYGCTALEEVELNNPSLYRDAFYGCSALKKLTIYSHRTSAPTLDCNFDDCHEDFKIYVPAEDVTMYKAATNWSAYADRIYPIGG